VFFLIFNKQVHFVGVSDIYVVGVSDIYVVGVSDILVNNMSLVIPILDQLRWRLQLYQSVVLA
jgi:hypothetical protein